MQLFYLGFWGLVLLFHLVISAQGRRGFGSGEQDWGHIEVREGAHLFYWLYYTTANVYNYTERPLVIWLQGGPCAAATALGNFCEIGPLDLKGNERPHNWVQHVNVLFIDSPVGSGFSYVTNGNESFTTSKKRISQDLIAFMKKFYDKHKPLAKVPLHIFTESFGGQMAADFAWDLHWSLQDGKFGEPYLLKSVSMGNPMISPQHNLKSYATFLLNNGFVDEDGALLIKAQVTSVLKFLKKKEYMNALDEFLVWFELYQNVTGDVYLYNTQTHLDPEEDRTYGFGSELTDFMVKNVTEVLQIKNITYGEQSIDALMALNSERLRSAMRVVKRLLDETPIKINIYSGQLDVICPTMATVNLIKDLQWVQKKSYTDAARQPIIIDGRLEGYVKMGSNFRMFWINRSGHLVPADNPIAMSYVLKTVIGYE